MTARNIGYIAGSPENVVTGNVGDTCTDVTSGTVYVKKSGAGTTTGWQTTTINRGSPQSNRLFLATLPSVADTVSIEGTDGVTRVYEFRDSDNPPVGGTAGRVWVYRGVNDTEARTNLISAINGAVSTHIEYNSLSGLTGFRAAPTSGTGILISETIPSNTARSCSETLTGAADIWDTASTVGFSASKTDVFMTAVEITANHIAAGSIYIALPFQPYGFIVANELRQQNELVNSGATLADGQSVNWVRVTLAGGPPPNNQAGDYIDVFAYGPV